MPLKLALIYEDSVEGSRIDLATYALKEHELVHLALASPNKLCNWALYELPYNREYQIGHEFRSYLLATNIAGL